MLVFKTDHHPPDLIGTSGLESRMVLSVSIQPPCKYYYHIVYARQSDDNDGKEEQKERQNIISIYYYKQAETK